MIDFNKLDAKCLKCNKPCNKYDLFIGQLCITCYEKAPREEIDNISDLFIKAINI